MTTATPRSCPHELRPGTTVCLHCLREQRLVVRARLRRRATTAAGVLLVLVALGGGSALFIARRSGAHPLPRARRAGAATPVPYAIANARTVPQTTPSPPGARRADSAARRMLTPILPLGEHALSAVATANRVGDTVRIGFDHIDTRTRRAEKFERMVRATLPAIYGAQADSILSRIPDGHLATGGDLITELPVRGIRLTGAHGDALLVWPETRPGRDGPLVVSYRVIAAR